MKIIVVAVVIAVAIPAVIEVSRRHARRQERTLHGACISNLRLLDAAKEQYAIPRELPDGAEVTWDNIKAFLPQKVAVPFDCPAGGTYVLHPIGEAPECSMHGNLTEAIEGKKD